MASEVRHEHNPASLRAALEHVCAHQDRTILMIRVDVHHQRGLEVVLTSAGRDLTEDQELRIAKALLPEVTELVRAVVGRDDIDLGDDDGQ